MVTSALPEKLDPFASENNWPFAIRLRELDSCLSFLESQATIVPKVLRIFGDSGAGKSFFVRELLVRYAANHRESVVIYVDSPASDFEAAELLRRIGELVSLPRLPDRKMPCHVPRGIADSWRGRRMLPSLPLLSYVYRVARDLIGMIPIYGQVSKAVLPAALPRHGDRPDAHIAALQFLMALSRSTPVILALDNVQFLPPSMLHLLDEGLQECGNQLKLIAVERLNADAKRDWMPAIEHASRRDLTFPLATVDDVRDLVRATLPEAERADELAETVFRRSEGNLKSAWFQLKLIAERRLVSKQERSDQSYENVIGSLRPVDQLVLRTVVVLLGGLTVSTLIELFKGSHLRLEAENVHTALSDLTTLGLLFINGENHNKVKIDHEIVSTVVHSLTPEEEKLELVSCLVDALCELLHRFPNDENADAVYDRLIGLVHHKEVRSRNDLLRHLIDCLYRQNNEERFAYICGLAVDSIYADVLDILPSDCIRIILNALQKCSEFSLGLVLTEKLQEYDRHREIATLYAAKYLVQLFRYDDAKRTLGRVARCRERDVVEFNILINQCDDEGAAKIATITYKSPSVGADDLEYDLVILRNSGHLFEPEYAATILEQSVIGFRRLGSRFGEATALNNFGIVEISANRPAAARKRLTTAQRMLAGMGSAEVYQPLVNLGALALLEGDLALARKYIGEARSAVPRLLAMDLVMLDFNETILDLCSGVAAEPQTVDGLRKLYTRAAKTKDHRFIEVVAWFTASMETRLGQDRSVDYSEAFIQRIRSRSRAAMEVFVGIDVNGVPLEAPYILSPHWRY